MSTRTLPCRASGLQGTHRTSRRMKRISSAAYQALREALAVIVWNKRPFESYLRTALRESPELLAGLPFAEPKRLVADLLVDRLVEREQKYQSVGLTLMLEVASMENFPN